MGAVKMKKKISGIFGLLVLALLLAVGMPGGMVKATEGSDSGEAGEVTPEKNQIENVTAENIDVEYDGKDHTIQVSAPEGTNIKYSKTGEEDSYSETKPEFKNVKIVDGNVGSYTIYYKVEKDGYDPAGGSATVTIRPKEIKFEWRDIDNLIYTGEALQPKAIATNLCNGDSCDISVEVEGEHTNANEGGKAYTAKAVGLGNPNYKLPDNEPTKDFYIKKAEIKVEVENVIVDYDGKGHGIGTISVTGPKKYEIRYGEKEDACNENNSPSYINVGKYNIYYKVTADNYNDFTGKVEITIKDVTLPEECKHENTKIINQEESTCVSEGYEGDKQCEYCKKIMSTGKIIAKNPQNHVGGTKTVNAKSATCTAKGYTGDTVCASCSVQRERGTEIPAKGYKWNKGKATKKSTEKSEGIFTYTCTNSCRHTKTEIIPRKSITVDLGKKAKVISKASGCKMSLANASKYKKYLTFNAKTGEVKTKKYYKVKINKSIPVKVKIGGKNYTVKVKIKIPAPNVKIIKKKVGSKGYRYIFKYNIKGANKIQVRMQKGGTKAINKYLDKNVSKQKSNKGSYINFTKSTMKKMNNKVTFKIVVYYGKNQSETLTITK